MGEFEQRLTSDVQANVERENKIAKTESAINGESSIAQDVPDSSSQFENRDAIATTIATTAASPPTIAPPLSTPLGTRG